MNAANERQPDDFERQLGEFSVVNPSQDFSALASRVAATDGRQARVYRRTLFGTGIALAVLVLVSVSLLGRQETDAPVIEVAATNTAADANPVFANVPASADTQPYVLGTHYIELDSPVPIDAPSGAQICIFFAYPCSHCYQFNNLLTEWQTSLPESVQVTQIPATWSGEFQHFARVFYTAEALGVQGSAHELIFQALHDEGELLDDELALAALFSSLGVSAETFLRAYNSDEVRARVAEAQQLNRDYGIQAVPSVTVNGRYVVTPGTAGGFEEMLQIAIHLSEVAAAR